jgi:hypothetical protein
MLSGDALGHVPLRPTGIILLELLVCDEVVSTAVEVGIRPKLRDRRALPRHKPQLISIFPRHALAIDLGRDGDVLVEMRVVPDLRQLNVLDSLGAKTVAISSTRIGLTGENIAPYFPVGHLVLRHQCNKTLEGTDGNGLVRGVKFGPERGEVWPERQRLIGD